MNIKLNLKQNNKYLQWNVVANIGIKKKINLYSNVTTLSEIYLNTMTTWSIGSSVTLWVQVFSTLPWTNSVLGKITPNRQANLLLHNLCLEVITVHGNKLRLFWAKIFPYSNHQCRTSDIAAVETIFNIFSFDTVLCWDRTLSPLWRRTNALSVMPRSRKVILCVVKNVSRTWLPKLIMQILSIFKLFAASRSGQ